MIVIIIIVSDDTSVSKANMIALVNRNIRFFINIMRWLISFSGVEKKEKSFGHVISRLNINNKQLDKIAISVNLLNNIVKEADNCN